MGEVARHHDGRAEQPSLRPRADRGGANVGRRGGRRRGEGRAPLPPLLGRRRAADDEQRHSAPDTDGGLNGLGAYGGLSFIIEAAVRHHAKDLRPTSESASTPTSSSSGASSRGRPPLRGSRGRRAREEAPRAGLSSFGRPLVNAGGTVTEFPVVEVATGTIRKVPTANLMTEVAVKRTVPTPAATPSSRKRRPRSPRCSPGTASRSRRSPRRGR